MLSRVEHDFFMTLRVLSPGSLLTNANTGAVGWSAVCDYGIS